MSVYPTYLTGQRLTADLLTSGQSIHLVKASDTSRASTTSATADPELTVTVAAGRRYQVVAMIAFEADAAADMRGGFTVPTNGTLQWTDRSQPAAATTTSGSIITNYQSSSSTAFIHGGIGTGGSNPLTALIVGTLYTGDGGTVAYSWAQSSSNVIATTLKAGSHVTLTPVA